MFENPLLIPSLCSVAFTPSTVARQGALIVQTSPQKANFFVFGKSLSYHRDLSCNHRCTWMKHHLYLWFILIRTCTKSLGDGSLLFQSFTLDTFPLHSTILKPDFDLSFRQVQTYSDFVSSEPCQVIIPLKFVLQFLYLMFSESCSFFSFLSGGFSGFCSCKSNKNNIRLNLLFLYALVWGTVSAKLSTCDEKTFKQRQGGPLNDDKQHGLRWNSYIDARIFRICDMKKFEIPTKDIHNHYNRGF